MTLPDEEPTPEEMADAEALARALDRGHVRAGVPDEALAAAALLRYARDGGALDPDRQKAILGDALARVRVRSPGRVARFAWLGAFGLATAAAAAFLMLSPARKVPILLPAPPRALLEAQAEAARSGTKGLALLGAEMTPYRAQLYAVLAERYRR